MELKRDKTPREVIAQVLDYASWVRDLSGDGVAALAEDYLGKTGGGPLDEAFRRKFRGDLPEELNKHHKMLIVASEIDSSTERIIKYLSEADGIGINAATFGFYRTEGGKQELLARTYLVDPREVETRAVAARRPNLTLDQLQEIADSNGVGDLYRQLVTKLEPILGKPYPRRILLAFSLKIEDSTKAVFNVLPGESSASEGLKFQAYTRRLSEYFGLPVEHIEAMLPAEKRMPWQYYTGAPADYSGCAGYFKTPGQIDAFVNGLTKAGTDGG